MTAKFRQIIDSLISLVTFKVDKSMSDDDFIANIDAINLLCNLYDDLGLDRTEMRKNMAKIYPELSRRIYGKKDIQLAMPLIKALYRYICDRGVDNADRGPISWRESYGEMCCKVVSAYRNTSLIHSTDYLYSLDTVCRLNEDDDNRDIKEYKEVIDSYLDDIDNVSTAEKIRRVKAYELSHHLFVPRNREKWAEIRESVKYEDVSQLDDETFLIWREITDLAPLKELKHRSGHSKRMQVEYLQALIFSEFKKQRRLKAKRKLNRNLKTLNDEFIGDIIDIKINADMSVSTLYALETIFYLRLQLAQVSWEDNEPIYESLCRDRFEQLSKALTKKYATATSLNEKIEILERLEVISLTLHSDHSYFALEEASSLEDLPNLTYAQRLRLKWLPGIKCEDDSRIVAELFSQANDSFVMGTIAQIFDFITDEDRNAVIDRYIAMVDAAIASNDTAELGKLLALAAYWTSNPGVRQILSEIVTKAALLAGVSLPEKRVNAIAAEIYAKIDTITGKYEIYDYIPA